MSLLKFGFSTSKIEVAKAQAPRTMTSEDRRKKKDEYEKKRERKYREEWGRDFTWLCYNADANIRPLILYNMVYGSAASSETWPLGK
jgi:hypothetical protein